MGLMDTVAGYAKDEAGSLAGDIGDAAVAELSPKLAGLVDQALALPAVKRIKLYAMVGGGVVVTLFVANTVMLAVVLWRVRK